MRTLSDTLARLARLRELQQPRAHAAPGRLTPLSDFGSNPGALKAHAFVPDDLPAGAALVVVLHGCTQNATDYDHSSGWSKLAERHGFAVLYPEQQRSNNANLCFNWFQPGDIACNSGEALSIRQMVERIADEHAIDPARIHVTGLSAGGAMTSAMLASYPETFASGAIIAGLAHGIARTIPEAFDRMRGHGLPAEAQLQRLLTGAAGHDGPWPTVSIWQGTADTTVAPSNADAILAQWRGVHGVAKDPTRSETSGAHRSDVWRDADGRVVIERHTIAGMAHGTPLDAAGGDNIAGSFMLDVGIDSTARIAAFFGLDRSATIKAAQPKPAARKPTASAAKPKPEPRVLEGEILLPQARSDRPRAQPKAASPEPERAFEETAEAPHPVMSSIQRTIEDALRKAGLMR